MSTYGYVEADPISFIDQFGNVRQGKQTGKWWEFTDRNFQRWFHLCWKQPGDPDASREELAEAHTEWVLSGKPDGKNGCGGPPPAPEPTPAPESPSESIECNEDCEKSWAVTFVIGVGLVFTYICNSLAF